MATPYDAFSDPITDGQGSAAHDPYAAFSDVVGGLDFDQPDDVVRAKIARLSGPERERALAQWADRFVSRERKAGGIGLILDDTARTLARGTFVGPYLDEFTAGTQKALQTVSGGLLGSDYDEALAYQRARDRSVDKEYPVASVVGQLAGGVAGGAAALRSAAGLSGVEQAGRALVGGPIAALRPAQTMRGNIAQAAGVGGLYGAVAGFGNAEGGDGDVLDQAGGRIGGAATGAAIGSVVGAALPPAITAGTWAAGKVSDVVSPQVARYSQQLSNVLAEAGVIRGERPPTSLSAAAVATPPVPPITGAEAAADQIIANQLSRAGVSIQDLRQRVADVQSARRFNANSYAEDVVAPVDLDLALQRLGSSVARQQPEAGNRARQFIGARQTGLTPADGLPEDTGLATRATLSRPDPDARPMGQYERVKDALKRALSIEDYASHGHAATAYRTEQEIVSRARAEADHLYGAANQAAEGVDLQPTIKPVVQAWLERAKDEPRTIRSEIRKAIGELRTERGLVGTLDRFDKAKQVLDDHVDKLYLSGDKYLGGLIKTLKNDLLTAVDGIETNDVGRLYANARREFSSGMDMRNALQLGRDVFRENSEIAVDQFRQLATPGEQKLFRLGLLDGFEQNIGRQKRTTNITQIFESPRIQELLEAVIPRSRNVGAEFANRPERFGRYLDTERAMVTTRDEVLGNSKTAQRMADDRQLNSMVGMIEQIKSTPSLTALGIKAFENTLARFFGFREDTAAEIARKLFTVGGGPRDRLLTALEARLGPNRAAQFERIMMEQQRKLVQAVPAPSTAGHSPPDDTPPTPPRPPETPAQRPPGMMRLGGPAPAAEPTVVERGQIVPLATYSDGSTRPAVPGLIMGPVESFQRLLANGYQAGTNDVQGVQDAFNVSGAAGTGGIAASRLVEPAGRGLGMFWGPKAAAEGTRPPGPVRAGSPASYQKLREVDAPVTPQGDAKTLGEAIGRVKSATTVLSDIVNLGANADAYPVLARLPVELETNASGGNKNAFFYRRGGGFGGETDRIIYNPRVHMSEGEDAAKRQLYEAIQTAIMHQESLGTPGRRHPSVPLPTNSPSGHPGVEQMLGLKEHLGDIVRMRNAGVSDLDIRAVLTQRLPHNTLAIEEALKYDTPALQRMLAVAEPGAGPLHSKEAFRLKVRAGEDPKAGPRFGKLDQRVYDRGMDARDTVAETSIPNVVRRDGAERQMAMDLGDVARLEQPYATEQKGGPLPRLFPFMWNQPARPLPRSTLQASGAPMGLADVALGARVPSEADEPSHHSTMQPRRENGQFRKATRQK